MDIQNWPNTSGHFWVLPTYKWPNARFGYPMDIQMPLFWISTGYPNHYFWISNLPFWISKSLLLDIQFAVLDIQIFAIFGIRWTNIQILASLSESFRPLLLSFSEGLQTSKFLDMMRSCPSTLVLPLSSLICIALFCSHFSFTHLPKPLLD